MKLSLMRKISLKNCVSVACLLSVGLFSTNADAMSLEEAVKTALSSHPTVQAAEAALRASKEDVGAAEGGFLPSVDLTGDTG